MVSHRSFIYDIKEDSWIEGPPLLSKRYFHCSCAIQSDDGPVEFIIIIGGRTRSELYYKTTEILNIKNQKWVKGPTLPCGIEQAACVSLPPLLDFACIVVGGCTFEQYASSDVYGLDKALTEWKHLGKIRKGRQSHIAVLLSKLDIYSF